MCPPAPSVAEEIERLRARRRAREAERRAARRARRARAAFLALALATGCALTTSAGFAEALDARPGALWTGLAAGLAASAALGARAGRPGVLLVPLLAAGGLAAYGLGGAAYGCDGCLPVYANGLWAVHLSLVALVEEAGLGLGLVLARLPWRRAVAASGRLGGAARPRSPWVAPRRL